MLESYWPTPNLYRPNMRLSESLGHVVTLSANPTGSGGSSRSETHYGLSRS